MNNILKSTLFSSCPSFKDFDLKQYTSQIFVNDDLSVIVFKNIKDIYFNAINPNNLANTAFSNIGTLTSPCNIYIKSTCTLFDTNPYKNGYFNVIKDQSNIHNHDLSFNVINNEIICTCNNNDCTLDNNKLILSININNKDYDGNKINYSITNIDYFIQILNQNINVSFYKDNELLSTPPTNIGDYEIKVSCGTNTISTEFSINSINEDNKLSINYIYIILSFLLIMIIFIIMILNKNKKKNS